MCLRRDEQRAGACAVGVELFRTIAAPCQLEKELQFMKKASAKSTFPLFFCCATSVQDLEKMAKGAKSMMQPINLIFRFLNHKSRVCIWLVEQNQVRAPCRCAPLLRRAFCASCARV